MEISETISRSSNELPKEATLLTPETGFDASALNAVCALESEIFIPSDHTPVIYYVIQEQERFFQDPSSLEGKNLSVEVSSFNSKKWGFSKKQFVGDQEYSQVFKIKLPGRNRQYILLYKPKLGNSKQVPLVATIGQPSVETVQAIVDTYTHNLFESVEHGFDVCGKARYGLDMIENTQRAVKERPRRSPRKIA